MYKIKTMKKNIPIRHSCNIGDLIASLAGLRGYWEETGCKFIYMQELNVDATYHTSYYHPTQHEGKQVMCNKAMFDMIKPLIEAQPFIERFEEYKGQDIVIDFNKIRGTIEVNMPHLALQSWYTFAFPDLLWDLSKSWIDVPRGNIDEKYKNKILLNFTDRYRNQFIDYYFLQKHQSDLLFCGTQDEYFQFCKKWELDIPHLVVNNFLELATVFYHGKFFLGNQSFCWNLNRAMNLPSILEIFPLAPNCIPFFGNKNYGFYHQAALEFYFNKLTNK